MNYRYPVTFYAVVLSILVFLHLSACSSLKKQQNEVPLWVSQGVSDPVYYIGVGHSEKSKSVTNYQEKANRAALQAIAEQIQVNLKSSSVLVNLEIDQKLIEDFSQIVQVNANHNLQGYERFALYETPTDYYVGYRLSRADHRNQITRQRKQALEKSQTFYQIALKKEQEQDYIAALLNYAQTLDASKNYISEVIYNQEDTTYYFLRDTYKRASQIMQAIQLTETPSLISLRYGAQTSHKLGTITIFDIPQKQVPLTIEFTAPASYQRTILTNNVGEVIFDIQKLRSKKTTEQLIAKVNLVELLSNINVDYTIRQWFVKQTLPQMEYQIQISPAIIYLQTSELNLNKSMEQSPLLALMQQQISNSGFEVTNLASQADYLVLLTSNTSQGGNNYGIFTSKLEATITIKNAKSEVIVQKPFITAYGTQLNYVDAGQNAYIEAVKQLQNKLIPEIENAILKL